MQKGSQLQKLLHCVNVDNAESRHTIDFLEQWKKSQIEQKIKKY